MEKKLFQVITFYRIQHKFKKRRKVRDGFKQNSQKRSSKKILKISNLK